MREATDWLVVRDDGKTFTYAARNRRPCPGYLTDFTVRSRVASDGPTEHGKILAGHGDRMLYIWNDENGKALGWVFIDLSVYRRWWTEWRAAHSEPPHDVIRNGDGSEAYCYRMRDCPGDMCIIVEADSH